MIADGPEPMKIEFSVADYNRANEANRRRIDEFLEEKGIDITEVFQIDVELQPIGHRKVTVWTYKRDENGNRYLGVNDELAYSKQVVYDRSRELL